MAARGIANPFRITKAVDFTDADIPRMFVDLPTEHGWQSVVRPDVTMPMLILGGKGVGRTHLMRYLSYPVRSLAVDALERVKSDRFIGIYVRASGLNASRFNGKGQDPERWQFIFSYYMDLWLAQIVLEALNRLLVSDPGRFEYERPLAQSVIELFDDFSGEMPQDLVAVAAALRALQREIDIVVNNVVLGSSLDEVYIRATRGRLVFGVPQAAQKLVSALEDVQFLYLLDEFENFEAEQQRYINTLVREREAPASFRIGARTYGIKTYETYSGGEENREGSEFEAVLLDGIYNDKPDLFAKFCREMASKRVADEPRLPLPHDVDRMTLEEKIDDALFVELPHSPHNTTETEFLADIDPVEREHLRKLRRKLRDAKSAKELDADAIEKIVEDLRLVEFPFLEKMNTFLFYQEWYRGADLPTAAGEIRKMALEHIEKPRRGRYQTALGHYSTDLLAQMLEEARLPQRYVGFRTFVTMAAGVPRNLMIILKHVYSWAEYNGEEPFAQPIGIAAQQSGVLEASRWFFDNARVLGERGYEVHLCIQRLGTLLRLMRFSDKPIESSCATFSVDATKISDRAAENLLFAEQASLLLRVDSGQKDRNVRRIDAKYQLTPMLAPIWALPIARRGAAQLRPAECDAIFDPDAASSFDDLLADRDRRMNAPFHANGGSDKLQEALPGV